MPTVVIVDDAPDMRMLVRLVLESSAAGYEVVAEAADGDEGLDVALSMLPDAPDILLLDNRMPRMTGVEMARAVRDRAPNQVVVLFSAHLDDAVREQAAAAGVDHCIGKEAVHDLPDLLLDLTRASD